MNRITRLLTFSFLLGLLVTTQAGADDKFVMKRFGAGDSNSMSSAVLVEDAALVHTTQLVPADDVGDTVEAQVKSVLSQLDQAIDAFDSHRSDVVKLNVYVSETNVGDVVAQQLSEWNEEGAEPAITFVTTALPQPQSHVAMDAVFAQRDDQQAITPTHRHLKLLGDDARQSHATVLPRGDVLYVSGQAEQGDLPTATRATLDGLLRTLEHLDLSRDHIVSLKCFLQPMRQIDVVNEQIAEFFGEAMIPPVSHVEWISSEKQPIEIELIAWAPPVESEDSVTYHWLPWLSKSPVYCRATRIHGNHRLYISGLSAEKAGDGEQQVRSIFSQLDTILTQSGSDLRHLAKATYYVSDAEPSGQLNKLRPEYYDPERPPAASKAMVYGVGHVNRGITVDMVAAPAE